MTETQTQKQEQPSSPILSQIGILNLSVNAMLSEIYKTIKLVNDANVALTAENAELKAQLNTPKQ